MSIFRKSDPSEIQEQGGQEYNRVYDPLSAQLLGDILKELKKINMQLTLMTDEEV